MPLIYDLEAEIALYCVFTGVDIFYDENIYKNEVILWDDSENRYYLKPINYLLSKDGESDLKSRMKFREERKNLIHSTLKRNVIPYFSKMYTSN